MSNNDKYLNMLKNKRIIDNKKETEYKESSKERLTKIINTKMRTVMIGALASMEANFGFLWGHGEKRKLTQEEEEMRQIYEKVRKEILDKGNTQSRNLSTEIEQYNIEWLRYNLNLPVIMEE